MERAQQLSGESEGTRQPPQAKRASKAAADESTNAFGDSPMMVAQRRTLQRLFGDAIQPKEEDDEKPLQGKLDPTSTVQRKGTPAAKPNNTGLPDNLKHGIESLSGMSMDNVRVHYNSSQPTQLNALAYAQGTDIHIAPGQEQHLPHEAWHVVQQAQGRVKPTMQMKDGVSINDDTSLEQEADVMGAKATYVSQVAWAQDSKAPNMSAEAYISNQPQGPMQMISSSRTTSANKKDQLAAARTAENAYIWSDLSHNVAVIDGNAARHGISDQASHSESKVFIAELTANNAPHAVTMLTERPPCTTQAGTGCYNYFSNYELQNPGWSFDFIYLQNIASQTSVEKQLYDIYRVQARNPRIPQSNAGDIAA